MSIEDYTYRNLIKCHCDDIDCDYYHNNDNNIIDLSKFSSKNAWLNDQWKELEKLLNESKSKTGSYPAKDWNNFTDINEISAEFKNKISNKIFQNKYSLVTRAWIKFYEILATFDICTPTPEHNVFRGLFLCEAPGGFINATNHYLKSNFSHPKFEWIANALNPFYEEIDRRGCVLDDTFIKETNYFDNWFFGSSNTGDIFDNDFADSLAKTIRENFQDDILFDCVTGDGSFDCSPNFEKQEEMVYPLIFKEVMIGLRFLRDTGNMVIKFFTFFDCKTITLLYFLSNCFANINCFKPSASKHGNSEIYLVCCYFKRNIYLNYYSLLKNIDADKFIIAEQMLPEKFLETIFTINKELAQRQSTKIDNNVTLFKFKNDLSKKWKLELAKNFIEHYQLKPLANDNDHLILQMERNFDDIFIFPIKKKFQNFNDDPQISELCGYISKCNFLRPNVFKFNESNNELSFAIKPKHGHPFSQVNNCKFVCIYMFKTFKLIENYWQSNFFNETEMQTNHYSFDLEDFWPILELILDTKSLNIINMTLFLKFIQNATEDIVMKHSNLKLHFLDLFHLTYNWNDNDFEICSRLRMEMANLIVDQKIKNGDTVCIRMNLILSRLNTGLIYILTTLFNRYSFYANSFHHSVSFFCILDGFNSDRLSTLKQNCPLLFQKLEPDWWNKNLLELISIPYLLLDEDFSRILWEENNCWLLFSSKIISEKMKGKIRF